MKKQTRNNHIYILDDLRGVAILAVVIYHYFFVYFRNSDINNIFIINYRFFNDYVNFGVFGVSLFFLVSGFVIPMSLKGDNKKTTIYNFFIRRFFRLYPTYWFAIIFISTIILVFKDSDAYSVKQILINFTMFQDILKVQSIDGVFWTLMVELKFYILTALLFYLNILKRIKLIVTVLFIISITSLYFSYLDGTRGFGNGLFSYLMLMYLGTSFYFYHINKIMKKELLILTTIVSFYFLNNHFFILNKDIFGNQLGNSIATLLAILSFIIALNYKKALSKTTTFFGNISYSFYLLHQVIGYFFIDKLLNLNTPLAQLITFITITCVAYIVNKYIEHPTNNFGHKYVKLDK